MHMNGTAYIWIQIDAIYTLRTYEYPKNKWINECIQVVPGRAGGRSFREKKLNQRKNLPIECGQGDEAVRCPNRIFCAGGTSLQPFHGGDAPWWWCDLFWCHEVGCGVGWSNVVGCEVTLCDSKWLCDDVAIRTCTTKYYSVLQNTTPRTTKNYSALQSITL